MPKPQENFRNLWLTELIFIQAKGLINGSVSILKELIMIVGVLKENKAEENRVSLSPGGVEFMRQNGHTVLVEKIS